MNQKTPPLQWLKAFEASARHSSFTAAAKELHLTPAAVSHQIRSLEEYLGFKMFIRLPKGLELTGVGKAYLPSLSKAFDDIATSTIGLFGTTDSQPITIRVSTSFSALCLSPKLGAFKEKFPHINLRLYTAVWPDEQGENLDEADIEIRYGDGTWQGWNATRLGDDTTVLIGTQVKDPSLSDEAYLRNLLPKGAIQIMGCEGLWIRYLRDFNLDESLLKDNTIITDNSMTAIELCKANLGLALVSKRFAHRYLDDDAIVQPIEHEMPIEQSHYVLTPADKTASKPEALIFKQWILEQYAR